MWSGKGFFSETACASDLQQSWGRRAAPTGRRKSASLSMVAVAALRPNDRESDDVAIADVALLFALAFDAVHQ